MSSLFDALGQALIHSLWLQLGLVIFFYALSRFCKSSRTRYQVLYAGLLSLPLSFAISCLWLYTPDATDGITASLEQAWYSFALTSFTQEGSTQLSFGYRRGLGVLVIAWLLGILFFSFRLVFANLYLDRLRNSAEAVSEELASQFSRVLEHLKLPDTVSLHLSESIASPMIIGVVKPMILIPVTALTGLTAAQLELILIHELAHVRRLDPLLNALQSVVETLFFYHPAVWFLSRCIRHERECACDDLVLSRTEPLCYASALTQLETIRFEQQLSLAATGGKFMNRIRRIVKPQEHFFAQRVLALVLLSSLLLAACSSQFLGSGDKSASLANVASVCLEAKVATGNYVMPAFNTASIKAMSHVLANSELELVSSCADAGLSLSYTMLFDAQKLSWQAGLTATNKQAKVVWSSAMTDKIQEDGAFQYTTENTAERLLGDFLSARD